MTTTDLIFPDSNPIVELRQVPKTLALGREYDDGVAEWLNGVVVYSPPSFMADTRGTWLIAYAQDGDDLPQVKYLGGPPTLDERQARADGLIVFWAQPGNWVYKRFDGTQCGGTADRILEELVHSGLRGPASGAVELRNKIADLVSTGMRDADHPQAVAPAEDTADSIMTELWYTTDDIHPEQKLDD